VVGTLFEHISARALLAKLTAKALFFFKKSNLKSGFLTLLFQRKEEEKVDDLPYLQLPPTLTPEEELTQQNASSIFECIRQRARE